MMAPAFSDVEPEGEPDLEEPCPNCDGTVAVWIEEVGETEDIEQCSITAFVHREAEQD